VLELARVFEGLELLPFARRIANVACSPRSPALLPTDLTEVGGSVAVANRLIAAGGVPLWISYGVAEDKPKVVLLAKILLGMLEVGWPPEEESEAWWLRRDEETLDQCEIRLAEEEGEEQ